MDGMVGQAVRQALTAMDVGEADLVLTPLAEIAGWAQRRGYVIRSHHDNGTTIYEIWPGDSGADDTLVFG
ncbi:hypothetical protein [Rugosimonospora africana]|uniref:Uncharacterized protein n=1 Tax=Rugosimonospora africana TaxID=556532 RepID=A0A8J3R1Q3_9ACTN|nr:hypothetical protein [Rugosimonospora africana]GIH21469.1 hypothetical protein Raf01_96410 [Rugosimonospora africana]